jgi:RNA polymerase sigma-70 factor (ECF subfamily)
LDIRREAAVARRNEAALDSYLVASARLGDRDAYDQLVRRWNGRLLAHAWRLLRDDEAARDAVQEGWIEILRGLARLRDDAAFAAWAYRIVSRRCARGIARARKDRLVAEASACRQDEAAEAPPDVLDARALDRALAQLPPGQQAAIALFYLEEMSVAEVAVALDVPVGTVKTRLMHARRALRGRLEGDE